MEITINRDLDIPIYRQIVDQVRQGIRAGTLPAGTRLPSVRRLAAEQGLTHLTVHSAYSELQGQGLIESHVGRGTFVSWDRPGAVTKLSEAASHPEWLGEGFIASVLLAGGRKDVVSFAQAFPAPESIPGRDLRRAAQMAMRQPGAFEYGPIQGHIELREQLASFINERGVSASPESMLITAGAQQAIDVILRACTEAGDTIVVEAPTYPGMLEVAALRRLNVIGVPSDDEGIRVDALEAACIRHRPRVLYLIPTCGNPVGRTLARERRAAILRLARTNDMLTVEDDIYGFLSFEAPSPPALKADDDDGIVVYLTSFSKMLAPALRVGAIVAPPSLLPRLAAAKGSSDLGCSSVLQLALTEYLRQGLLQPHLERMRRLYRERFDAMEAAIERYLPSCTASRPEGGLSLLLWLPDEISERELAADALEAGVAIVPGQVFFPGVEPAPCIRLAFGMLPAERIEEGVRVLGRVLETHLRRVSPIRSLTRGVSRPLV